MLYVNYFFFITRVPFADIKNLLGCNAFQVFLLFKILIKLPMMISMQMDSHLC